MKVLVQNYLEFGSQTVSLTNILVHELLLPMRWLEEAWREYQKPVKRGSRPGLL